LALAAPPTNPAHTHHRTSKNATQTIPAKTQNDPKRAEEKTGVQAMCRRKKKSLEHNGFWASRQFENVDVPNFRFHFCCCQNGSRPSIMKPDMKKNTAPSPIQHEI
jgi:hypothetical protein